jgi:hypothetical protein
MPDPSVVQTQPQGGPVIQKPSIIWYGERGVVNALVAALAARDIEVGVKRFLREVKWADDGRPLWIDDIKQATLIVEVGLNDFGDPDLIMVCQTGNGDRFVVIVEAKVITYLASALSNTKGMVAGKNSNINRQLTLRYRFTLALADWDGRDPVIIEPEPLFRAYAEPVARGGLKDPNGRPRRLGQGEILRRILAPQEVHSLPLAQYHLVAMTWDREPFFRQPEVTDDLYPLFLNDARNNLWDSVKGRVGWIGFKAIKNQLKPGPDFDAALQNMVYSDEPGETGTRATEWVRSKKIEKHFKDHGLDTPLTLLLARLQKAAEERFGSGSVKEESGSRSISIGRKVLVKLIPQQPGPNAYLLLGLSEVLSPRDWCDQELEDRPGLVGSANKGQPFFFLRLPQPPQEDVAVAMVDSIFRQLAERMGLGES